MLKQNTENFIAFDPWSDTIIADIKLRAQYAKKHPHKIFKWSAAPWERLKKETSDFTEIFMQRFATSTGNNTVSEMWDAIDKHIQAMKKLIPSKMAKTRTDQPWLTSSLKRQCNPCKRKFRRWKTLKARGKPCKNAREVHKNAQMEKNKLLKKARLGYINAILEDALESKDPKPLFRHLKTQKTDSSGIAPLKEDGQVYSNARKKADILAKQFRSVFTIDQDKDVDTTLHGPSCWETGLSKSTLWSGTSPYGKITGLGNQRRRSPKAAPRHRPTQGIRPGRDTLSTFIWPSRWDRSSLHKTVPAVLQRQHHSRRVESCMDYSSF